MLTTQKHYQLQHNKVNITLMQSEMYQHSEWLYISK